jgi:hypothetical protein
MQMSHSFSVPVIKKSSTLMTFFASVILVTLAGFIKSRLSVRWNY